MRAGPNAGHVLRRELRAACGPGVPRRSRGEASAKCFIAMVARTAHVHAGPLGLERIASLAAGAVFPCACCAVCVLSVHPSKRPRVWQVLIGMTLVVALNLISIT